jgi:hypothetical protein
MGELRDLLCHRRCPGGICGGEPARVPLIGRGHRQT